MANKISTLLFTLILLCGINGFSQECSREGAFTDGPDYPVKGKATLISAPGKNLLLKFSSDFSTETGPDLDVYLSNTPKPEAGSKKIEALKSISGAQEYELPADIKLEDYKYVIIHCTQFNHFWGNATLGEVVGNCTTTGIENRETMNHFVLAKNNGVYQLTLSPEAINTFSQLAVYNMAGQKIDGAAIVATKSNYQLNGGELSVGLYVINLIGNGERFYKNVYIN